MLTISNRHLNSVFERIIKDKNGNLARVRFVIIEKDGVWDCKIVSFEPILNNESGSALCLPFAQGVKLYEKFVRTYKLIISPYVSSLEFFMSQPTRAPAF